MPNTTTVKSAKKNNPVSNNPVSIIALLCFDASIFQYPCQYCVAFGDCYARFIAVEVGRGYRKTPLGAKAAFRPLNYFMITRKQKEEAVKKIKDKLGKSSFIAFLNFHGLSVAKAMELRRALKKAGADYFVSKKTLLGVAAKEAGLEMSREKLEGEIGTIFAKGEDETLESSKEVAAFARKNKDMLKIIGGFWQKAWIGADEIKRLAEIPPREVMLTQLAFMLSQPVASLARALQVVEKKLSSNQ